MLSVHPSVDRSTIEWNDDDICPRVRTMFGFGPAYEPWRVSMKKWLNVQTHKYVILGKS